MVDEPETLLYTEVVVLTEKETVGEGVDEGVGGDEFEDDWASTMTRKANPRTRAVARRRVWKSPTMTMVGDEVVARAKESRRKE